MSMVEDGAAQRPQPGRWRPHTWPGRPYPLGASFDGRGVNVAVFSEVAERVELCLFDREGNESRVELQERTGFVWHAYLPAVGPGVRYGFRVHGPWQPSAGLRCNPAKLLIDPYAKSIEGDITWNDACYGYDRQHPDRPDGRDSAPYIPRSVVVNPWFDWGDDRPPRTPWGDTIIYETHVKGLTARHPEVPAALRGTYAGLAHPVVIDHLKRLGVTAVELQPVQHFLTDHYLAAQGLTQYWGYNTIGFLAPQSRYAATGAGGQQVHEFKAMVADLHRADLEVLLDVVYNHTGESDHTGPQLSLRGLDNLAYYRLDPSDRRRYVDYSGTGNSLNMLHPNVLQLITDSLRYWITEMHVDGFRFDLASSLARELHDVDRLSAFFDIIQQDPVISQAKLIAEPWDVGEGGYQVGNFPVGWTEWNDRYRDTVRAFWKGERTLGRLASRLSGSSDLYAHNGRTPHASVNFVTAHDGFTLADLVSYERKHNEANLADADSGHDNNISSNHGVEGPTDDPEILALRARQQRNFLATLLLSQGVPMLLGGDEMGRTQQGNNNPYCIDGPLTHVHWHLAESNADLVDFTARLIALRSAHIVFRRPTFFTGDDDLHWLSPEGVPMQHDQWHDPTRRAIGFYLNGEEINSRDARGEPIVDDSFLVLLNGDADEVAFTIPDISYGAAWRLVVDTGDPTQPEGGVPDVAPGEAVQRQGRSAAVLRRVSASTVADAPSATIG